MAEGLAEWSSGLRGTFLGWGVGVGVRARARARADVELVDVVFAMCFSLLLLHKNGEALAKKKKTSQQCIKGLWKSAR